MRHLIILMIHLITTVLRVVRAGGVRAVAQNPFPPTINY
jgi:hypothetical protein